MARYSISQPAYLIVNGCPLMQHFKAGSTIEVADDLRPAEAWTPLDDAAHAAVAARNATRKYTIAPNGVQAVDRETGAARVAVVDNKGNQSFRG